MVPGCRTLIDTGYKYNTWKVLYFIVTEDEGSIKSGIPYLYKYPGHFIMLLFALLLLPLPCISSLDMLMWLIPTTNQGGLI